MIEIWTEFGRFKATNQRLADHIRKIPRNSWFSDHEVLEIHQQIYWQRHQQTANIVTETINTGKPKTPKQTRHDNVPCIANTKMHTLTQEEKNNRHTIKRIMSEKKTTLHFLNTGGQSSPKPKKWATYW